MTEHSVVRLLKPEDVADALGVPERTLAQWRHLNKGPAYVKIGRHVRYRPSDVVSWVDEQERGV